MFLRHIVLGTSLGGPQRERVLRPSYYVMLDSLRAIVLPYFKHPRPYSNINR